MEAGIQAVAYRPRRSLFGAWCLGTGMVLFTKKNGPVGSRFYTGRPHGSGHLGPAIVSRTAHAAVEAPARPGNLGRTAQYVPEMGRAVRSLPAPAAPQCRQVNILS